MRQSWLTIYQQTISRHSQIELPKKLHSGVIACVLCRDCAWHWVCVFCVVAFFPFFFRIWYNHVRVQLLWCSHYGSWNIDSFDTGRWKLRCQYINFAPSQPLYLFSVFGRKDSTLERYLEPYPSLHVVGHTFTGSSKNSYTDWRICVLRMWQCSMFLDFVLSNCYFCYSLYILHSWLVNSA